jgi:LPS-assembly lipoprotein
MTKPLTRIALVSLGLGALALSGCAGFTPLYAASGVTPKLAAIEVQRADGRLGYMMGQDLDDALARDSGQDPIYRLTYTNREQRIPRGLTISNVASRYEVDVTSNYVLTEIATHKVVTAGKVSVNVTYDVVSQPYDALQSTQDGERRVAEQAAERIRIELASYFAAPRPIAANAATAAPIDNASAYTFDRAPSVIQSPRERALSEPASRNGQGDFLGQPAQTTVAPDGPQPFSPSQDPNNPKPADPGAIQTIPDPNAAQ